MLISWFIELVAIVLSIEILGFGSMSFDISWILSKTKVQIIRTYLFYFFDQPLLFVQMSII